MGEYDSLSLSDALSLTLSLSLSLVKNRKRTASPASFYPPSSSSSTCFFSFPLNPEVQKERQLTKTKSEYVDDTLVRFIMFSKHYAKAIPLWMTLAVFMYVILIECLSRVKVLPLDDGRLFTYRRAARALLERTPTKKTKEESGRGGGGGGGGGKGDEKRKCRRRVYRRERGRESVERSFVSSSSFVISDGTANALENSSCFRNQNEAVRRHKFLFAERKRESSSKARFLSSVVRSLSLSIVLIYI